MGEIESLVFYLILYASSAFCLSLSKKGRGNKKIDIWFIIAVMIPVLIAALRDNVGTDFENYSWMYKNQIELSFSQWFNYHGKFVDGTPFGIWAISQIAKIFDSQEVFFGLAAFLILIPVLLFIKNELPRNSCFLNAFLFLTGTFTTGFNMIKQGIAIAFIIYGLRYVFERKFFKFLLFVAVAYLFHPSAIVAIFIYYFRGNGDGKFSIKRFFLIALAVVFLFSITTILERVGGRFASYVEYNGAEEFNNRTFYLELFWCFLFFLFSKKFSNLDSKNDTLIILFLVGLILSFSGFFSPAIKRIARYYTLSNPMLLSQFPLLFSQKEKPIINLLIFTYAIAVFTISFYYLEHADIIPYNFITRSVI